MAQFFELPDDVGVAVEDVHSFEEIDAFNKFPFFIDRRIDIETVRKPCFIIFFTVARSDVDGTGAGIGGNIIGIDNDRLSVDEGVPEGELFESFR